MVLANAMGNILILEANTTHFEPVRSEPRSGSVKELNDPRLNVFQPFGQDQPHNDRKRWAEKLAELLFLRGWTL